MNVLYILPNLSNLISGITEIEISELPQAIFHKCFTVPAI